ncbi:MerR family transcriptional regulator [Paenibacillus paeoniae]|uniref:MerR family transcriptional regulator n=1 Tax=Paenibacillus paeoniae TaxID=2292705 RepID=A0A371PKQ5_9BACL|nr:MerR family transcriptional regulator [Paenibacillus paeoniae]REK76781.1 MerR family transcriptional regulator [Paenibacillus paeoniae]
MLSIGEFSKICGVSTKTLRYYAEVGLIHPEEINPESGYRYYSIRQLKKMLFINRLKSYHFSLDEIRSLLEWEEDQADERVGRALQRKIGELQQKMDAYAYTMEQMKRDAVQLENGIPMMAYLEHIEVQLVETPPMNLLYTRQLLRVEDYAGGYGPYFSRLYEQVAKKGLTLLGTPITIYHSPEFNPAGNDTEFAIPVMEIVTGTRDFPGGLCAKSVLRGPYSEMTSVHARLREWIENEGFELSKAPYEVYVTNPAESAVPADIVTEVYFPVRKK